MEIFPIEKVIPETNIVFFSPHYDDFLLGMGGYIAELVANKLRETKNIHVLLIFSRSNYQVNSGSANYDTRLPRIKLATGNRLIEDLNCLDELLGAHSYRYELLGENEALLRSKKLEDTGMEFPFGSFQNFNLEDEQLFARMLNLVRQYSMFENTALVFPLAIKSHIDHFIAREAGIAIARELGAKAKSQFYFQEDKPYAGIQTSADRLAVDDFIAKHTLERRLYKNHPDRVVELAFKHYLSQVDDSYQHGVRNRSNELKAENASQVPLDQLFHFYR